MSSSSQSQPCGDAKRAATEAQPSAAYRPDEHKFNHWVAMVGQEPLTTPAGIVRRFRTEYAAQEAAELDVFLREDEGDCE